ncbi:TonB-dependent receptor [Fulvivirga sp. M361]|uniref:TonB-dependent receptor n=1 Tax=Fulvivirga sp. M361 TaxID=2594266 RepID=UPI00117A274E|nr:TonB-dependent receptor [Fulvivirga sp. M361]TRX54820.1 TonB-dependent receptor [Fulvivirga sp. M361]
MLHLYRLLFFAGCLFTTTLVAGQGHPWVFSGVIKNQDNQPIDAAAIKITPGSRHTVSNQDGTFMLSCPTGEKMKFLEVSHLAYQPVRILLQDIENHVNIIITMHDAVQVLQTVEIYHQNLLTAMVQESQPIQVVDREFIEKNNTGTFSGALASLPGVSTMNVGVGIAKPVIRGMSFNRILVNNRGIKQEGQQWGADHGLEVDPFDVESVEVIKGPASLLYGSDGLGGVINIRADKFLEADGDRINWISSYQSNNDAFSNSMGWQGRKNNWVYGARLTHQAYGDYTVPANEFTYAGFNLPIYENRLKNTAGRELHYSVMMGRTSEHVTSTVRFSAFNQEAGIFTGAIGLPRSYNLRHENRHRDIDFPRQENQHLMLVNNNTFTLGKNKLEIDLGIQWNQRKELSFPGAHGIEASAVNSNLALGLRLTTYTANVRYQASWAHGHKVLFGGQAQYMDNEREGFEFLLPDFYSAQFGLFNYHVWEVNPKWILNAGIRYDHGQHTIQQHLQPLYDRATLQPTGEFMERTPDFDREFENFSGAAGVNYLLTPGNNIKVNFGNSFRFPSAIELSSNGVHHGNFRHEAGDPSLDIERGYQTDVTFSHESKRLLFELSAFYAYYQQYIYLAPTGRFSDLSSGGTLWQYRQDDALFNGLELMANYQLPFDLKVEMAVEWVQNLNLRTDLPLPLTPAASVLLNLEYSGFNWAHSIFSDAYIFTGAEQVFEQSRVDRNERTTPDSFILNAGMGCRIQVAGRQLQFRMNVNNVFNSSYFNHISRYRLINLPEQGRNLVVSLKVPVKL